MKGAIKFGFGFAFGAYLFSFSRTFVNVLFERKFDKDAKFRERVKVTSPRAYAELMKKRQEKES